MKLYKFSSMAISANADPYVMHANLSKHYDNVSYYNPFNKNYIGKKGNLALHPLDGIKVEKIFSGKTKTNHGEMECEFKLDINMEIFSERGVIMTTYVFDFKDKQTFDVMIKIINFNYMVENVLSWHVDGRKVDCSIMSQVNDFVMKKLFAFFSDDKLKKAFHDMDPTDKKSSLENRRQVRDIGGLHLDVCGGSGMNSTSSNWDTGVVFDEKKEIKIDDSLKKYSRDRELYHSKSMDAYICFDMDVFEDFLFAYRNYNLYGMILLGYDNSFEMWSHAINRETEDLITNLDNKNEIFWQDLRLRIEEWQLHFLSQNSNRMKAFSRIKATNLLKFSILSEENEKKWLDSIEKRDRRMERFIDELRYSLDNIATPGKTHDEQRLQKESEITNERILLLSFLAMSIPMLGAIFSPNFSLEIKIISAGVLLSLPAIYFSVFRLSKRRKRLLARKEDFLRKKAGIQKWVELHSNNIEEIRDNDKMPDDIKKNIIAWEEENINIGKKMIEKIDKKLK